MATYTNVTLADMESFLIPQGFRKLENLPKTVEVVFGKRVYQDDLLLTLRVYTGINPDGNSREVGEDAIRVGLYMKTDEKIIKLASDKRVHRVKGWRKNLQNRIDGWLELLPKHSCPKCKSPLLVKNGKNGKFLGCASYPNCNHTQRVPE